MVFKDHLAQMNAYTQLQILGMGTAVLNAECTGYCIRNSIKAAQHTIANLLNKSAIVLLDEWLLDLPVAVEHIKRLVLIFFHERGIAHYVRKHYSSKLATRGHRTGFTSY
jgi:hypothetical protein